MNKRYFETQNYFESLRLYLGGYIAPPRHTGYPRTIMIGATFTVSSKTRLILARRRNPAGC